jgi:hypothetical protein
MKILIIGDSFAADWSVKYNDYAGWPNLLAQTLVLTESIHTIIPYTVKIYCTSTAIYWPMTLSIIQKKIRITKV